MWQIVQIVQPFSVSFQKMSFQSFYSAFYGPKYKLMQILMIKSDKLCDSTFHNWTIQWLYVVTQVQLLRSSFVECCIYWNLNLIIQLLSLYWNCLGPKIHILCCSILTFCLTVNIPSHCFYFFTGNIITSHIWYRYTINIYNIKVLWILLRHKDKLRLFLIFFPSNFKIFIRQWKIKLFPNKKQIPIMIQNVHIHIF